MSEIIHIHNHIAFACECGSVHFHLLKSGSIECAGCQFIQAHTWETPTAWEAKHHAEMSYVNDIAELQLERDRLTAANEALTKEKESLSNACKAMAMTGMQYAEDNEALKGEVTRQHGELRRVAEFANCMGNPVEYEDDTVYLKHLKASAHVYSELNAKYREALERIAVFHHVQHWSKKEAPTMEAQIAREALGEEV